MGNEISTLGGAIATAGTAVAAGVTFGQVRELNQAVEDCAKFTAKKAEKTLVRHAGETLGVGVATAATAVAAGVTFGQVDALNKTVAQLAHQTARAGAETGKGALDLVDGVTDGIPVIAHVKGGIMYAVGESERGDRAMRSGTRTTGVMAGGVAGFATGGPIGAIAGGVAAGAAMDGAITGVESAINGQFTPSGQIAAWDGMIHHGTPDELLDGLIGAVVTPVMDGVTGAGAGKVYKKAIVKKAYKTLKDFREGVGNVSAEEAFEAQQVIAKYADAKLVDVPVESDPGQDIPDVRYGENDVPRDALTGEEDVVYRGDRRFLQEGAVDRVFEEGIQARGFVVGLTVTYWHINTAKMGQADLSARRASLTLPASLAKQAMAVTLPSFALERSMGLT